jgi:7-keto-8-aminopelargonate synthetase-like enzyme
VDEAHALGVRRALEGSEKQKSSPIPLLGGLIGELGLQEHVEVQMGTLGKALGVSGGYLAGSEQLIEFLFQRSRSQIYSTAIPPAVAVVARAAIRLLAGKQGKERHDMLWSHLHRMHQGLQKILKEGKENYSSEPASAILPWVVGEAFQALRFSQELWDHGYYVAAIRYPTVARGKARLRFTVTASHTEDQIEGILGVLGLLSSTVSL